MQIQETIGYTIKVSQEELDAIHLAMVTDPLENANLQDAQIDLASDLEDQFADYSSF